MRALSIVNRCILEIVFFVAAFLLGVATIFTFGYLTPTGLLLQALAGFALSSLIRNCVWRRYVTQKDTQTYKKVCIELLVYVLLVQGLLVLTTPNSSLVHTGILERFGLMHRITGSECNVETELEDLKSFWGNRIDFEKVTIASGGLMHHLWRLEQRGVIDYGYARTASAFGNTIYLYNATPCPWGDTYAHEMTHVWQYENMRDTLFGLHAVPKWLSYQYNQLSDPEALYNYDGEAGLEQAQASGVKFLDFGIEEQAMIIEDFYLAQKGYSETEDGEELTPRYKELLQMYVDEMLAL